MSQVINVINNHRSIRKYIGPPSDKDLENILHAAIRAPTAWNLMPISIQVVRDKYLLRGIGEAVGGQSHVINAPVLLVYSLDYAKIISAARKEGVKIGEPGPGLMLAAAIDAGIMVGWTALAAESLGYGVSFIALYSNPCKIADILELPRLLIPVVGLVIGVPGESPSLRRRQSIDGIVGFDGYGAPTEVKADAVISVYSGRASRLLGYVVGIGGYLERVNDELKKCLQH